MKLQSKEFALSYENLRMDAIPSLTACFAE